MSKHLFPPLWPAGAQTRTCLLSCRWYDVRADLQSCYFKGVLQYFAANIIQLAVIANQHAHWYGNLLLLGDSHARSANWLGMTLFSLNDIVFEAGQFLTHNLPPPMQYKHSGGGVCGIRQACSARIQKESCEKGIYLGEIAKNTGRRHILGLQGDVKFVEIHHMMWYITIYNKRHTEQLDFSSKYILDAGGPYGIYKSCRSSRKMGAYSQTGKSILCRKPHCRCDQKGKCLLDPSRCAPPRGRAEKGRTETA